MRISKQFTQKAAEDLDLGDLFLARISNENRFCLAIQMEEKRRGLICLLPGHPQAGNQPGVYEAGVIGRQTVLCYPDATVTPIHPRGEIGFQRDYATKNGTILLQGDEIYIVAATSATVSGVWRMSDGARSDAVLRDDDIVSFPSYEVAIYTPDGTATTLFTARAQA